MTPIFAISRRSFSKLLAATALTSAAGGHLAFAQSPMVLRRGNAAEPSSIDPHRISGIWESNIVGDLFLGLTTENTGGKPIPGAAESWTINPENTLFTFKLRPHKWSDGTPVTAHDFVYAYRRILDPQFGAEYASVLYTFKNGLAVNSGQAATDQLGVRAIDDLTLEIATDNPAPYLFELLMHQAAMPVPRHAVEAHGNDWIKPGNFASNGAYTLADWRPNDHVRAVKNPHFYDAANVRIEEVYYYPTDDQIAAIKRFRAGELDMQAGFPSTQIDMLRSELSAETRLHPFIVTQFVAFNCEKKPFDDARVRNALSMAIDRETVCDRILKAGERPAYNLVPHEIANYKPGAYSKFRDLAFSDRLARAKQLLAEAGFGEGNPLRFQYRTTNTPDNRRLASAFQNMWKQIGAVVELVPTEARVHYADLRAGNYEVSWGGWIADFSDPKNYLFLAESTSGQINYSKYNNPAYDAKVAEANRTGDVSARADLILQAEQILLDDQPYAPFLFGVSRNIVAQYVKGFEDNPTNVHRTRWMSVERPA